MKKVFFALFAAAFMLTSFSTPVKPVPNLKKKAGAVTINQQFTFPVSFSAPTCNGDVVDFTGTIHTDIHGVMNNNKISFHEHLNYAGISGTSETTGAHYAGGGESNFSGNANFNGAFTVTQELSVVLTTAGQGNNLKIKGLYHMTVNANGDVTSYIDSFSIVCQ